MNWDLSVFGLVHHCGRMNIGDASRSEAHFVVEWAAPFQLFHFLAHLGVVFEVDV